MGKPAKCLAIQVNCEWLVGCDQEIDSHIELFSSDQKWVVDVSLNNIWIGLRVVRDPTVVILSFLNLTDFVEEEDPLALGFPNGFHNSD